MSRLRTGPARSLSLLLLVATSVPMWLAPDAALSAPLRQAARDQWMVVKLAGEPVGYAHELVSVEGSGDNVRIVTTSEQMMSIKRLGAGITIKQASTAWEDMTGRLLRVTSSVDASAMTMKSDATIGQGEVTVKSGTAGQDYENKVPFTGELWGMEKIRKTTAAQLKKVGDTLKYQMYESLQSGGVVQVSRTVVGVETLDKLPAVKVEEVMEGVPFKNVMWLDAEGVPIKMETSMPAFGGSMVAVRGTKQEAMAAAEGHELHTDVFKASVARSNIRLPQPRGIDRLQIRLLLKDPQFGWPELSNERQKTLEKTGTVQLLEIRKVLPSASAKRPAAISDANREFLEPNSYLQSDDPEIKRIATEVAGKEGDAFKAGQALERWVYTNLTGKGFGVGFASASEVCKNRSGDCSEHAVFLAALCRAAGIPSRVAIGLEYLAGMWGGHAWTEVQIGSEWIALDATLGLGYVDACHLRMSASTLRDGLGKDLMSTGQLLGNIEIKVVEYDLGGKTVKVGERAEPYILDGDSFQNPWLGVALSKPAGYRFDGLDAVYPDLSVLTITGPGGEGKLRQSLLVGGEAPEEAAKQALAKLGAAEKRRKVDVGGHTAIMAVGKDVAGIAVISGTDLWVLSASGAKADELLEDLRKGFTVR